MNSILKKDGPELQSSRLSVLLNDATRALSKLPLSAVSERSVLNSEIKKIRSALSRIKSNARQLRNRSNFSTQSQTIYPLYRMNLPNNE